MACNPGTGSKISSKNATDTNTFGTKDCCSSSSVPPIPRTETEILQSSKLQKFTFSEPKGSTRNFWSGSLLGKGGFGSVFKGWIDEHTLVPVKPGTRMIVTVKKLKLDSFQGHREWLVGALASCKIRQKLFTVISRPPMFFLIRNIMQNSPILAWQKMV